MQHMHDIIPYFFDCWADSAAHLLILKSSMHEPSVIKDVFYSIKFAAIVLLYRPYLELVK